MKTPAQCKMISDDRKQVLEQMQRLAACNSCLVKPDPQGGFWIKTGFPDNQQRFARTLADIPYAIDCIGKP